MFAERLLPSLSRLDPPRSLGAASQRVCFNGVCSKKLLKAFNCTIVESCLGEAPWRPGPLQFVGFNQAFPRSDSVQILCDSCFFFNYSYVFQRWWYVVFFFSQAAFISFLPFEVFYVRHGT